MVVVVVFFSSRTPPDEDLMKALTILHPGSFSSHYAQPQQKDPKPELMAKPSSVCTLSFYSWHKALKEVCKAFSFVCHLKSPPFYPHLLTKNLRGLLREV